MVDGGCEKKLFSPRLPTGLSDGNAIPRGIIREWTSKSPAESLGLKRVFLHPTSDEAA